MGFSLVALALFVCVLVALLALYFKRSVPMFITLILLAWQPVYIVEQSVSMMRYHISLSIFIPLVFIFLGLQSEKGIFNKSGLAKSVLSLVFVGLSYALANSQLQLTSLLDPILGFKIPFLKPVNDITLILFILTILLYLIKLAIKKDSRDLNVLIAFVLAIAPFMFSIPPYETGRYFALSCGSLGIMLVREAHKMAFMDALTQIPSRRALEEYAKGLTPPYSLCMVDIDHFKKFNDTYGHDIGDEVLRYVAKELKGVRGGGKVFRYGGEEFTIIFANKFSQEAQKYLQNVRETISKKDFIIRGKNRPKSSEENRGKKPLKNKTAKLSVSMGLCDSGDAKYIYDLFILADKALYKAKNSGRDCLRVYQK